MSEPTRTVQDHENRTQHSDFRKISHYQDNYGTKYDPGTMLIGVGKHRFRNRFDPSSNLVFISFQKKRQNESKRFY